MCGGWEGRSCVWWVGGGGAVCGEWEGEELCVVSGRGALHCV